MRAELLARAARGLGIAALATVVIAAAIAAVVLLTPVGWIYVWIWYPISDPVVPTLALVMAALCLLPTALGLAARRRGARSVGDAPMRGVAACACWLVLLAFLLSKGANLAFWDRYAGRFERDLAAGRARMSTAVRANERLLDTVPRYPGAQWAGETQNPQEDDGGGYDAYDDYVHQRASAAQSDLIETQTWGTFRAYRLPRAARLADVSPFLHDAAVAAGWVEVRVEGGGRVTSYSFARGDRCLWIHVPWLRARRGGYELGSGPAGSAGC